MNTAKMFYSVRIGLIVILSVAILVTASASCSRKVFAPPSASTIATEAPMEIVTAEFWRDYKTDPTAAAAKYGNRDLLFPSIQVDQMTFLGEGMDAELYVQEGVDPDKVLVKFRTEYLSDIINVRDGYIVKIVGRAAGIKFGYVSVDILWLQVTDPPGGDLEPPSEY